jgi:hypothetical protein
VPPSPRYAMRPSAACTLADAWPTEMPHLSLSPLNTMLVAASLLLPELSSRPPGVRVRTDTSSAGGGGGGRGEQGSRAGYLACSHCYRSEVTPVHDHVELWQTECILVLASMTGRMTRGHDPDSMLGEPSWLLTTAASKRGPWCRHARRSQHARTEDQHPGALAHLRAHGPAVVRATGHGGRTQACAGRMPSRPALCRQEAHSTLICKGLCVHHQHSTSTTCQEAMPQVCSYLATTGKLTSPSRHEQSLVISMAGLPPCEGHQQQPI